MEDAKRYGTLPFAGLARAGFIAVQMLRSLVAAGVFTTQDHDDFLSSVSTVSGQLMNDRKIMNQTKFMERYGHLRPGTYEITSLRYDEAPDSYFDWSQKFEKVFETKAFELTKSKQQSVEALLDFHEIETDAHGLFKFIKSGIEQRELAKFHFTKNLSDALSLVCEFGMNLGISRQDLAFLDVKALQNLHFNAENQREVMLEAIERGKERYENTSKLSLPPLITNASDVWAFR